MTKDPLLFATENLSVFCWTHGLFIESLAPGPYPSEIKAHILISVEDALALARELCNTSPPFGETDEGPRGIRIGTGVSAFSFDRYDEKWVQVYASSLDRKLCPHGACLANGRVEHGVIQLRLPGEAEGLLSGLEKLS